MFFIQWNPILALGLLLSSVTQAAGSQTTRVVLSIESPASAPRHWSFLVGQKDTQVNLQKSDEQAFQLAKAYGFSFELDQKKRVLKVLSSNLSRKKSIQMKISTKLPVELEGDSKHWVSLVSPGGRVVRKWSSPSLTYIPRDLSGQGFQIDPSGVLEVQALTVASGEWINQGKILSSSTLDVVMEAGKFRNLGVMESQKRLRFIDRSHAQSVSLTHFVNEGRVVAPEIEVGSLFERFYSFKNGDQKSGSIQAKIFFLDADHFMNSAEIHASEKIDFSGLDLDNQNGSLHSGGTLRADFVHLNNAQGSLSGLSKTELKIRGSFENEKGEVGVGSLTELSFYGNAGSDHLGKVQGTDLGIHSDHGQSITLKEGDLRAEKSISIDSEAKIQLPQVQLHTPLLNLSVPDFQLDEQTDCASTVVHCDPTRHFRLSSPYCTQGGIHFLESARRRLTSTSSVPAPETATQQDLLVSPQLQVKQRVEELQGEVSQAFVHFQKGGGRSSQFHVSIHADLKSSKNIEFIAPLANIYVGDAGTASEVAIEGQSLRAWANFFFLINGHVACQEAAIAAPSGLRIGKLKEHPTDRVQVGEQSFPYLCRNGVAWATEGTTAVHGPLNCDGSMQVGADLVVQSEKDQWSMSPDIRVQGDLVFQGRGAFSSIRSVGPQCHLGDTPLPSSYYSEPGIVRVEGALVAEKPMHLRLYSTSLYADEFIGDLSIKPVDSVGDQEIQFPGEKAERYYRASVSSRKGGTMRLEGRNNEGLISSPQLFLVEKKGEFILGAKNPFYFDKKDPIQDLMKKGFHANTVYLTPDLAEAMQKAAEYRFHFSLKERFFFKASESERFYDQIKNDLVILKPGIGLIPLPAGQVVFSLSPQLLLKQVQDSCQENLMRGYLYEDRPITLELLTELHRNASEYLDSLGIRRTGETSDPAPAEQDLLAIVQGGSKRYKMPAKPLIFYQQVRNEKGIQELKPYFYLPPALLDQIRSEQTGNVFARVLSRFPEGTTAEEMLALLPEKSGVRKALIEFFEYNPQTKEAVTQAALRAREEEVAAIEDSAVLNMPIRAAHVALVVENDITVEANLKSQSAVLVAKTGNLTIETKKSRKNGKKSHFQEHFHEEISDPRTLEVEGHLELRAGKDIRTSAVQVNVGSLVMDAQGNIIDQAHLLNSTDQKGDQQSRAHVSQFKVKDDLQVQGAQVILEGTKIDSGSLDIHARAGDVFITGVQETRFSSDENSSQSESRWVAPQWRIKGHTGIQSERNILTHAVDLSSGSLKLQAKGDIIDAAVKLRSSAERKSDGREEQESLSTARVSHFKIEKDLSMSGKSITLHGTDAEAEDTEFAASQGSVTINGVHNETSRFSKEVEETGALFWKGEKTTVHSESHSHFVPPKLKSKNKIKITATQDITLQAPTIQAQETYLQAERVRFLQGRNKSKSSDSESSTNAFWVHSEFNEEEHETYTQAAIQGKVKVNAKVLEFEKVKDQVLNFIDQIEYDPAQVEVVSHLLEEFHHRKEESISAPGPALIAVVAIAASIATAGVGGVAAAGMSLKAASLAGTMTSAAISSLTAKVATQLVLGVLAQQSPENILNKAFSAETLKGMITSAVTAGTLYEVQCAQKAAGTSDFLRRIENAGAQSGVSMGARLAFGEQNLEDALKSAGVQFVSQTGSGYVADRIGTHFAHQKDPLDRAIHKLAHGGSAAGFAALGAAALNQDVGAAAAGAATGAMISEIVAETLRGPLTDDLQAEKHKQEAKLGRPLTKDEGKIIFDSKKADISNLARLTGALSGLLTGSATGVASAQGGAQTALANNFEVTLDKQWGEIWANLNTPPEESGQQKPLSFDYRELAENGVAPLGESAPMTEFDTDQVQAARQAEIEKGFKNGTIQVKLGADGNVTVQTDPRTLPHLAPNLHRVPNHRTDLPVEEDPVPEMILGGGIQIGVHRAVKGACFPGETAICLSDNQSTPIESIREGDFVESYNMASQARECRRVERIFHHVADHLLILTIGEKTLRATDNHPFYLPAVNRWVEAQSLQKGDELQTLDGDTVRVDEIRGEDGKFPVFNFEVESTHTYYAEGVLVHNCGGAHAVQEMGAAYSEARVFDSAGHGLVKLEQASIKTPQGLNNFSKNPLKEVKYTNRVEGQVKRGDFHGFPDEVDNFAGLGKRSTITGGDGIPRTKIELEGGYMNRDGHFEWIIEPDGVTVNHRLFVPKK